MTDSPAPTRVTDATPPRSGALALLAWLGLAVALGGTALALDALASVARGGGLWLACVQTQGLGACSNTLDAALVTRGGLNVVLAGGAGLLGLALGPVPGVIVLGRRRERWAAASVVLLVLLAYGLLGLLLVVAGLLAAAYVLLPVLL